MMITNKYKLDSTKISITYLSFRQDIIVEKEIEGTE